MLKKTKQQVLDEIRMRATSSCYSTLVSYNPNISVDMTSFSYALQQAIGSAVAEGFRTLLENQYTDADFESDLTLTK